MRTARNLSEKLITGLSWLGGALLFPVAFPLLAIYWHLRERKSNAH